MEKLTREQKYQHMRETLNEKQWRQYLGMEAKEQGNIAKVACEAKVSRNRVKRGMRELEAGDVYKEGERIRKEGGGRRPLVETDSTLLPDLEKLLDAKGDPMSLVQWTSKSLSHLVKGLVAHGHTIKKSALAEVLHQRRFSLRANKKTIEGKGHPDRNAQFEHIDRTCETFQERGDPAISVDCKKKELLGNFKNNGREWQAKGEDTCVNVYDFASLADGKAIPYGIYDVVHKSGFVNVGIDHDTAAFAVESIRRWWRIEGSKLYPDAKEILITPDGGGSNGSRNRLWKKKLQEFANEEHLTITVAHYPPATSKWNKIEHRLFSFISINWRAIPLTSLEVVIQLISGTTNEKGLTVSAIKDSNIYPTGVKITKKEMKSLNIVRDSFHGEWNYTIKPQPT
jgi:Rhodopirellula transposase DDE domain